MPKELAKFIFSESGSALAGHPTTKTLRVEIFADDVSDEVSHAIAARDDGFGLIDLDWDDVPKTEAAELPAELAKELWSALPAKPLTQDVEREYLIDGGGSDLKIDKEGVEHSYSWGLLPDEWKSLDKLLRLISTVLDLTKTEESTCSGASQASSSSWLDERAARDQTIERKK